MAKSIYDQIEEHRHTIRALEARQSTASTELSEWLGDQIDRETAQIKALELKLDQL